VEEPTSRLIASSRPPLPVGFTWNQKIRFIVVQPTSFCNINCSYCYLPSRDNTAILDINYLERGLAQLFENHFVADQVAFLWHAGEPLVVKKAYYQEIFKRIALMADGHSQVEHRIQTNGTLIDQSWCEIFRQFRVRIGLSLDGPQNIHDRYRKRRNGQGSFSSVMKGIEILKRNDLQFSVITVLSRESVHRPREMFDFFSREGIYNLAFNIEESDGVNSSGALSADEYLSDFDVFMRYFWNECRNSIAPWRIREFRDALMLVLRPNDIELINYQVQPFGYLIISADGSVTTFSPEFAGLSTERYGKLTIGKLCDHPSEWVSSATFQRMARDVESGVRRCRETCGYFSVCGGGAPANKLGEHGTLDATATAYCKAKTKVIDIVLDSLSTAVEGAEG
jgi:uncharacterized protein